MNLGELLQSIIIRNDQILLVEGDETWKPQDLFQSLSKGRICTRVHIQPGLYIAEIDEKGYLGRVLYKIKRPASG